MADGMTRGPNTRRRRDAYEILREASEEITSRFEFVAVRKTDLAVVLDMLLDAYPHLGDHSVPDDRAVQRER